MSKRSTVTSRDQPLADVTAASGASRVGAESLTVHTRERLEVQDLTESVMSLVRRLGVREGLVNIFSMHTTCTIFINEFQQALVSDIKQFLDNVVDPAGAWLHNDPAHSDCDRMNADAHLRAMMLGHSLTLQVSGGEIVLGQWQRILLAELDGPRARAIRVQVMGIA
jgi:secondary thiamine-phosphate synthase enzyme